MAKKHNDACFCELYNRKIQYGECYEVQEVRNDDLDMEYVDPFDLEKADHVCNKCRWYIVTDAN